MIKVGVEEFFIEPLEKGQQMEEERGRLHRVYRRSAIAQNSSDILPDFQSKGIASVYGSFHLPSRLFFSSRFIRHR
ncbi:ADAMTS3: ADAM metallopeptidase with thrombospondin type 1 motif 3 [Crotalus adamanteus]|uniref:ADAMTS3: ADAM metallopeptidase with thrombospondin type 1 motif 3 n=1 Tax=Crotalus adamanteus TaxID=8729 RepID=A0AAW1BA22_CROAD